MSYKLTFEPKPNYLHAKVTGTHSREAVAAYLEEVRAACVSRGCPALLIEERLEGTRLNPLDVFEVVADVSERDLGELRAIAYVDVIAPQAQRFAETVAVNRGIPVAVFGTVAEAERWLAARGLVCPESKGATRAGAPEESR